MSDLHNFDVSAFKATLPEKTDSQINEELNALMMEEKRLDLEIKRDTVSKIKSQRQSALDQARAKMIATKQFLAQREASQRACNHRKGGQGAEGLIRGQGTSAMYSVIKHRLPNNRLWVLCTRCFKEWHPAHIDIDNGVVVNYAATPGWEEAVSFPSDNTPSGSSSFLFETTVG